MKKFLASALMLLAASTATFAQHAVGSFTLQPKVGLNIASLTKYDGSDPRYGVAAGAEFEYQATDIFSLSFGALYSQQGGKMKDGGTTYTRKADYVNVPIMANVYVAPGLAVKLGVQPGFNVNSKFETTVAGTTGSTDIDAKSVDFSIPVGLSYEYKNVVLDARYNWGLTKVFDNRDYKNSVFQITLGYKFEL
jgi:opacity protein-like surface antigen